MQISEYYELEGKKISDKKIKYGKISDRSLKIMNNYI